MRKLALVVSLTVAAGVVGAGLVRAQEGDESAAEEQDRARPEHRRHIQVLQDPHDIASFYRSSQEPVFFGPLGMPYEPAGAAPGPYGLASFYRNDHGPSLYGYSRFWTNGYGWGAPRPFAAPTSWGRYGRYGRRIGQNGDIFLMAPTFLAPVGPLTGVFLQR
jgi:hypothetical protein